MASNLPPSSRRTLSLQSVQGQALALVPLGVGLIFGALVLPRSVPPDEIPSPIVDGRALAKVVRDTEARAARVLATPLSSRVRAVGSAFRAFNLAEANHADESTLAVAKEQIVEAVRDTRPEDEDALRDLRAYQETGFLAEVRRYEATGRESDELRQLGGTFLERMAKVGWLDGRRVRMPESALSVAFKMTWDHTLLMDRLGVSLDESRALYAFYFQHPHLPDAERTRVAAALAGAHDAAGALRARALRERATAGWTLSKIGELAAIDPAYPTDLARAAALYMRQDYRASATVYEAWLERHPGGLWSLRVKNHLRAALVEAEKTLP